MTDIAAPAQALGHGITCIDTLQERPGMACCYLIERGEDVAFIEAGTSPGVPRNSNQCRNRRDGLDTTANASRSAANWWDFSKA